MKSLKTQLAGYELNITQNSFLLFIWKYMHILIVKTTFKFNYVFYFNNFLH